MTMIERVAFAVFKELGMTNAFGSAEASWERSKDTLTGQTCFQVARAAIEAMRELTPPVVRHLQMNTEIGSYVCDNWTGGYAVMDEYQSAMIDAALEEGN